MRCNVFAAKGIIQLLMTSCRRRDRSVAAAFAAKGISLSAEKGGYESAQRGRSMIYDCLVINC